MHLLVLSYIPWRKTVERRPLGMHDCAFCKLINKELPAWFVYEDQNVICFLPLEVEAFGHTIITPTKHFSDLFVTPSDVLNEVLTITKKIALHYQTAIGATGVNLLHASGVAAQQSVMHVHFHLIPRFDNDSIDAWPTLPRAQYEKDELLEKLRI
jgi:histidine triad (HIT) family protein